MDSGRIPTSGTPPQSAGPRQLPRVRSLGRIILVRVLIVTMIAMAVYEGLAFQSGFHQSHEAFETAAANNLERLRNSLSVPLWYLDNTVIARIMEAAARDRQIMSLSLVRADGTVEYRTAAKGPDARLPPDWLYRLVGTPLVTVSKAEVAFDGKVLGSIEMESAYLQLWDTWEDMSLRVLVEFGLFVLLYALVIGIGYVFLVKRPLGAVLEGLQAIKQGNFQHPIILARRDEFWLLAHHVSDMSHELATMYARLAQQNHDLEKTVNERTRSLVESEKRALVSKLVAGVAHELNTPIGNVMTTNSFMHARFVDFGQLVQSGLLRRSELDDMVKESLEGTGIIGRNISTAADLVNTFRQVSTDLFAGHLVRFNVVQYLRALVPTLERILEKSSARLSVDGADDLMVTSYPNYLSQILISLCINASMHAWPGPDGDKRQVYIKAGQKDGMVSVRLANNGRALDASVSSHLFEPFFSTGREKGGTGLGLYIVRNIVEEQLKGRITATSPLEGHEEGVEFAIFFPDQEHEGGNQ